MGKFIKYEIKGTYKYILGVMALVIILTTALYGYIVYQNKTDQISTFGNLFISLSVLILFGTSIVTFFYIVGSFRKELYEDRGYLTFTLPISGHEIVASKLIVALMWFLSLGILVILIHLFMIFIFATKQVVVRDLLREISVAVSQIMTVKGVLLSILLLVFSLINILVSIYFSMTLGKVSFRNKKIGGLWFIIFLILTVILGFIQLKLVDIFPTYINLNTFEIGNTVGMVLGEEAFTANIASNIFSIISTTVLFFGTGYLIERKIDL